MREHIPKEDEQLTEQDIDDMEESARDGEFAEWHPVDWSVLMLIREVRRLREELTIAREGVGGLPVCNCSIPRDAPIGSMYRCEDCGVVWEHVFSNMWFPAKDQDENTSDG